MMPENLSRLAWAVWRRNLDVYLKSWRVNLLTPAFEPVLYLLALGFGVGSYISEIDGVPYVRFIAPALVAISVMNASFFECTYGSYVRMYYQKTFDAIVATPVSIEEVIPGEILWGVEAKPHRRLLDAPHLGLYVLAPLTGFLYLDRWRMGVE